MKFRRHGYTFTYKKDTKGGLISLILAIIAYTMTILGVIISYKKHGDAGIVVGALGSFAFLISTFGVVIALRSFKERDSFYVFTWIGTIANLVLWILLCFIIGMGVMKG